MIVAAISRHSRLRRSCGRRADHQSHQEQPSDHRRRNQQLEQRIGGRLDQRDLPVRRRHQRAAFEDWFEEWFRLHARLHVKSSMWILSFRRARSHCADRHGLRARGACGRPHHRAPRSWARTMRRSAARVERDVRGAFGVMSRGLQDVARSVADAGTLVAASQRRRERRAQAV